MLHQDVTRPAPAVTGNRPQESVRFAGLDTSETTITPWKIQRLIDRHRLTPAVAARLPSKSMVWRLRWESMASSPIGCGDREHASRPPGPVEPVEVSIYDGRLLLGSYRTSKVSGFNASMPPASRSGNSIPRKPRRTRSSTCDVPRCGGRPHEQPDPHRHRQPHWRPSWRHRPRLSTVRAGPPWSC